MAVFALRQPITTTVPAIAVEKLAVGTHVFQLVVVNSAGVSSDAVTVTVTVRPVVGGSGGAGTPPDQITPLTAAESAPALATDTAATTNMDKTMMKKPITKRKTGVGAPVPPPEKTKKTSATKKSKTRTASGTKTRKKSS